jgi:hypothetical protein
MARGDTFTIVLDDVQPAWQNLYVSAVVYNRQFAEHGIVTAKPMRQQVHVRNGPNASWVDATAEKEVMGWPVHCAEGAEMCDEAFVLLRSGLPHRQMRLQFTLLEEDGDTLSSDGDGHHHAESFMGEVVFRIRHETEAFTWYELWLRHGLVAVSAASLCRFLLSFRLSRSCWVGWWDWQPAQQALMLVVLANSLNNNPLFVVWVWSGAWYMQLVEQLEQSLVVHALALWVLVVFDGMSRGERLSLSERQGFWLGKLLLVGSLWFVDSLELVLYQLAQRADLSAVPSDLPLYPWLWVYAKTALQAATALYALTVFFRSFVVVTGASKVATLRFAPFITTATLTMVMVAVAQPYELEADDFSSLWVFISMATLNGYVALMAVAFEPSPGARASFELPTSRREETEAIINTITATSDDSAAAYSAELLVRSVVERGGAGLTLEQRQNIGVMLQRNPATSRSVKEVRLVT